MEEKIKFINKLKKLRKRFRTLLKIIKIEKNIEILKNYLKNETLTQKNRRFQKISNTRKRLFKEGKLTGWISRNKRSYAEKFWEAVLKNNNIDFIPEKLITKKELGVNENGNYFLDFLIGKNIDLEIDGKQHNYKDRKESDELRDSRLKNAGYLVYRIPFINPNTKENKKLVKKQINNFLKWINKYAC